MQSFHVENVFWYDQYNEIASYQMLLCLEKGYLRYPLASGKALDVADDAMNVYLQEVKLFEDDVLITILYSLSERLTVNNMQLDTLGVKQASIFQASLLEIRSRGLELDDSYTMLLARLDR